MNRDIIPINYAGGTGGNFLCHFIVTAKYNNYEKYKLLLSRYGNAHSSVKDFPGAPYPLQVPDDIKVNYLLTTLPDGSDKTKPYYSVAHILNNQTILDNFEKSIRIVYDKDDFEELTMVFMGKYALDCEEKIFNETTDTLWHHLPSMRFFFKKYSKYFKYEEGHDNVCYVTWKELYHLDPSVLIEKLSNFTGIPKENFSKEHMYVWRKATAFCIDSIIRILGDKLK